MHLNISRIVVAHWTPASWARVNPAVEAAGAVEDTAGRAVGWQAEEAGRSAESDDPSVGRGKAVRSVDTAPSGAVAGAVAGMGFFGTVDGIVEVVGTACSLVVTGSNRGDGAIALANVTVVGRGSLGTVNGSVDSGDAGQVVFTDGGTGPIQLEAAHAVWRLSLSKVEELPPGGGKGRLVGLDSVGDAEWRRSRGASSEQIRRSAWGSSLRHSLVTRGQLHCCSALKRRLRI